MGQLQKVVEPFLIAKFAFKNVMQKSAYFGWLPKKKPNDDCSSFGCKGAATYSPGLPVPSAWRGLTSLFGMGMGGTPAL